VTSFNYEIVASPLLGQEALEELSGEYERAFAELGGRALSESVHSGGCPPIFFLATGGTERLVVESVYTRARAPDAERSERPFPVILVAHPGNNSLPAALEVLARLQQDGMRGRVVFLESARDERGLELLRRSLASGESYVATSSGKDSVAPRSARRPLAGRRIGLVGQPSEWLVASSPEPSLVRDVWGAETVEIVMAELERRVRTCDASSATLFARAHRSWASRVDEPEDSDLVASGMIHAALRSLVDEYQLDAVALRCFDLVMRARATGCLALSRLADQGVVAACEGDLPSAIAMLWVRELLGEPSWMANAASVDVSRNTLVLAHCTIPISMVSVFALRSHFESGVGAAVEGEITDGPATVLRIGGARLDRIWLAEADIVSRGRDSDKCRTQVELALRGGARVSELLERPLGNHLVLTRGHVARDLREHAV